MLNKVTVIPEVKSIVSGSSNENLEQLGILASSIAHDFNNLLTNMMGHMSLALLETSDDDHSRYHIEKALKTAEYASALTSQLLNYSRGKSQTQYIEYIDLNEVVGDVVGLLENVLLTGLTIDLDLSKSLSRIEISQTQMQQIVMNLLINAAEAIDDPENGKVVISTGRCHKINLENSQEYVDFQEIPFGNYVFLQINDNGKGICPDMLSKIFDPLFTTKPTGRGLGLSTIVDIVREHKGTIKVESDVGKGTTFKIYFPYRFDNFSPIH
jgi:two-component system, cell cycle sensor histidine kinase and response regulator CckA